MQHSAALPLFQRSRGGRVLVGGFTGRMQKPNDNMRSPALSALVCGHVPLEVFCNIKY